MKDHTFSLKVFDNSRCSQMSNAFVKLSDLVSLWLCLYNITSYYSKQKKVIQEHSSDVIGSVSPERNSPEDAEAGVPSLLDAAVVPALL